MAWTLLTLPPLLTGDKRQPACLRCEKLGKPCPGYDKKRKFVDEGVSLRKKYQSAPSGRSSGEDDHDDVPVNASPPSKGPSTPGQRVGNEDLVFSELQDRSSTLLPKVVLATPSSGLISPLNPALPNAGSNTTRSEALRTNPEMKISESMQQAPLDIPGSVPTSYPGANFPLPAIPVDLQFDTLLDPGTYVDGPFDPAWFDLDPDIYYANQNNSCGFIPNAHIVDEVDRNDFKHGSETATGTPMSISALVSFAGTGTGSSSLWPPEDQIKTSAIITDEREHEMAYLIRHFTEFLGPWMDLFDKDKHFSQSVPLKALRDALLRNAIAAVAAKQLGRVRGQKPFCGNQCQRPSRMEVLDDLVEVDWFYKAANYYDKAIAFSRVYLEALSGSLSHPMSVNKSDDLLVAVSIFSLYESLDNREMGWLQHLAGLKSLLTAVSANQQEIGPPMPSISVARKACFWNFARSDYSAAYINRRRTYLDTEDLDSWRSCGLQVQDNGALYADTIDVRSETSQCGQRVQLVSHTLIWLVLRVTNYLAQDSNHPPAEQLVIWDTLNAQLDAFYGSLPETFQPCAQIRYPLSTRNHRGGDSGCQLTEVFFSSSSSASSVQLYHFARILLLLNKPRDRSGISRLQAYREVSSEAIKHAREIVGVALGRPAPAVRVEMLLPLYIAGGCLEGEEERKVVLEIMQAIEKDTGCSTEVTVRTLLNEWGWVQEPQGVD